MHIDILSSQQQALIPLIRLFRQEYYLAGGTAIALTIGHRQSIDFDLFTPESLGTRTIEHALIRAGYRPDRTMIATIDEYTIIVAGVKLSFLSYPFPIEAQTAWDDVARLPDIATLAAMKAYALGRRAKWKDYVNLYFLIRDHLSVTAISDEADRIFGGSFNTRIFREQLAYFDGIDYSEGVIFTSGHAVSDADIRTFLTDAATR